MRSEGRAVWDGWAGRGWKDGVGEDSEGMGGWESGRCGGEGAGKGVRGGVRKGRGMKRWEK